MADAAPVLPHALHADLVISSSWLNLVERFFADLTLCVRNGNFASVNELVRDIKSDLAEYNADRARAMALMPKSSSRNLWWR